MTEPSGTLLEICIPVHISGETPNLRYESGRPAECGSALNSLISPFQGACSPEIAAVSNKSVIEACMVSEVNSGSNTVGRCSDLATNNHIADYRSTSVQQPT
jgi:hypothetical protein